VYFLVDKPEAGDTVAAMPVDVNKIRQLREKRNLTQEDAAWAAGLNSRQHWNQIETGLRPNITVSMLEKIAKALKIKAKDLLK
jgi:transcriptional regulator with XRE-family HTH domain